MSVLFGSLLYLSTTSGRHITLCRIPSAYGIEPDLTLNEATLLRRLVAGVARLRQQDLASQTARDYAQRDKRMASTAATLVAKGMATRAVIDA
ncbi:hypothetical protein BKA80DRAFT_284354 [Phyllosticta citrichinensis]